MALALSLTLALFIAATAIAFVTAGPVARARFTFARRTGLAIAAVRAGAIAAVAGPAAPITTLTCYGGLFVADAAIENAHGDIELTIDVRHAFRSCHRSAARTAPGAAAGAG